MYAHKFLKNGYGSSGLCLGLAELCLCLSGLPLSRKSIVVMEMVLQMPVNFKDAYHVIGALNDIRVLQSLPLLPV